MPSNDSDWRKMYRVLSGAVAKDITKEERQKQKEEYTVDRTLFGIKDWDAEFMLRNLLNRHDLSDRARTFLELSSSRFRQMSMIQFIQQNQDSMSTFALLDLGDPENNPNSYKDIMHFIWHFRYDLGPWMQGKLVEIIGPMRSGKNNFAVYMARAAMSGKIHVITSFPMFFTTTQDGPLKNYYREAHGLREALLYMIQTRYKEPEAIFFLILDEQTTRGASNMRSNSIEAEWANGWIVRSGHFGCTTIRLMQSGDETIKMQKSLRYAEIYKTPVKVTKAEGKFVTYGDEWPLSFQNIPDMSKYFNTSSPGSWVWDLDPQAMNDYMAIHEGEAAGDSMQIYRFYERYIMNLMKTNDPYWFSNKKFTYLDKVPMNPGNSEPGILLDVQPEAPEEKMEPLPVHHENCPKLNGLTWTWTPKKYIQEGQWVTCSKCKRGFKVHYSEEKGESRENIDSNHKKSGEVHGSDLMREGYRGMGHEEKSGKVLKGDTASLNTKNEDLPGKKQEDPPITDPETMAAEDLAADAFELFMELVQDPEKRKALESDPELNTKFNQLMNTKIPAVDINRVTEKISRKRRLTMKVPELEAESMKLRNQAAEKKECTCPV